MFSEVSSELSYDILLDELKGIKLDDKWLRAAFATIQTLAMTQKCQNMRDKGSSAVLQFVRCEYLMRNFMRS